jgi:4-amino-4-deoxy-L-arabinose transferase-like glycosyltransferase
MDEISDAPRRGLSGTLARFGLPVAIVLGAAARLGYVLIYRGPGFNYTGSPASDSYWYDGVARVLLSDPMSFTSALHPPLYPIFVAAVYAVFGEGYIQIGLAQTALDIGAIVLLWLLARRIAGEREAIVAAFLYALYPGFIFYTGNLISEGLFVFLLISAALLFATAVMKKNIWTVIAASAVFGLCVLTRANALIAVPLLVVWAITNFGVKKGIINWLVIIGIIVVFITPWTIRNAIAQRDFVPISTGGGGAFYGGNNETAIGYYSQRGDIFTDQVNPGPAENARSKELFARGTEWITENPGDFVKLLALKAWRFIEPYPQARGKPDDKAKTLISLIYYILILPFLLIGLFKVRKDKRWMFPLVVLVGQFLTALIFFGGMRVRDPAMPFALIAVSIGVVEVFGRVGRKRGERSASYN